MLRITPQLECQSVKFRRPANAKAALAPELSARSAVRGVRRLRDRRTRARDQRARAPLNATIEREHPVAGEAVPSPARSGYIEELPGFARPIKNPAVVL